MAGVWLSLEQLRGLSLPPAERLALQRQLLATPQPRESAFDLLVETAQLTFLCCDDAVTAGAWDEALQHHDELLRLIEPLIALNPNQAEAVWATYGTLLGQLAIGAHKLIVEAGEQGLEPRRRVELSARLVPVLHQGLRRPFEVPAWLPVLEEQIVHVGALAAGKLLRRQTSSMARQELAPMALELALRLAELLDPTPGWLAPLCTDPLDDAAAAVLDADPFDGAAALALIGWLERAPLDADDPQRFQAALLRARLALELAAPEFSAPSAAPASPVEHPAGDTDEGSLAPPAEAVVAADPALAGDTVRAELVFLPPGVAAEPGQLDLGPLFAGAAEPSLELIDDALDDFCWHLPKGAQARQAMPSLMASLEPQWGSGFRLPQASCGKLAYAASTWQRRLQEKLEPLPTLDWHHGLLVELHTTEMAVLAPLLADVQGLEPVLAQLRRLHHDTAFWSQGQEVPWMEIPEPLEALRRLHSDEGFYAAAHDPLSGLRQWGEGAVAALLDSDLWTNDAAGLSHWLVLAQELVAQGHHALPPLGCPPEPDQILQELAGLEVVYVGERHDAVQAAHRAGRLFRGDPFGLRCLPGPESRYPRRPAGGFAESLAVLLEAVDQLHHQRPFAVLLADCGAYRLPLMHRVHQRYGAACLSSGRPMAAWLSPASG